MSEKKWPVALMCVCVCVSLTFCHHCSITRHPLMSFSLAIAKTDEMRAANDVDPYKWAA